MSHLPVPFGHGREWTDSKVASGRNTFDSCVLELKMWGVPKSAPFDWQ
jgi:hypothetical protein